jgi:hypothetical protein
MPPNQNLHYKIRKPKTKSDFRKKLMNENNIVKYKAICQTLLKEDEELSKLFEITIKNQINPSQTLQGFLNNNYESFLEQNFFSDSFFLYKLESVLISDDNSKNKKEKFLQDELKLFLNTKYLDIQITSKFDSLNSAIDDHIKRIQEFEFFN